MASPHSNALSKIKTPAPLNKIIQNKNMILQMKVKDTQLDKTLKTLAKADDVEYRLQQAKEQQFRMKFEKYLTTGNFETSLKTKDTFKRTSNHSFETYCPLEHGTSVHKLIYTNGEVDVDKVVCLHLLSVHLLSLASCANQRNLQLFRKRSKPNMLESSVLPFFILEIVHKIETDLHLELADGEEVIILVNTNLEKLIVSILEVLAIVSPHKLQRIKEMCLDKKAIQEIMIKPKIYNFLAQAKECSTIFKIENYCVEMATYKTEPTLIANILTVTPVKVKDKSKKLECIENSINKMITLYTEEDDNSGESWSMFHKKFCSCRRGLKSSSSSNAIALLNEDGREFALVTDTGCHLPKGSSVYSPSLTAIIKSRQPSEANTYTSSLKERKSSYSQQPRAQSVLKNEQNKLVSTLLHKVKNSKRLLIGQTAARLKTQVTKEKINQKTPINKIMEKVFSKQSLISFASTTENEELKLLFQPCCKGGLGIGSFILEPEKTKPNRELSSILKSSWRDQIVPTIIQQERSIMDTALIKQKIFSSETRMKMKLFLQSENPGQNNSS